MPLVPVSKRIGYTAEEVAEHKTAKSLWVIINRKVYDVTTFYKRHPGGPAVLLQMGGKDATAASAAAHKNALPANLMWEFCIGSLVRFKAKPAPAIAEPPPVARAPAAPLRPPASTIAPSLASGPGSLAGSPGGAMSPFSPAKASTAKAGVAPPRAGAGAKPQAAVSPRGKASANAPAAKAPAKAIAVSSPSPASRPMSPGGGSEADGAEDRHSEQADLDDDLAMAATGGEEALRGAASTLRELLCEEPTLKQHALAVDAAALEECLRVFLRGAFDGGDWPAVIVKRSFVESHFPDIAAALRAALRRPLPLGEDLIIAAIHRLHLGPGSDAGARSGGGSSGSLGSAEAADPRVARFFEAIRDLMFFSVPRAKPPGRARPRSASEGKSGKRSALGDATVSGGEMSKVPNGIWRCSDGYVCTVHEGVGTCVGVGAAWKAEVARASGWRVASVTGSSVVWEGRADWTRLTSVREVEPLAGVWRNREGAVCVIADGQCTFVSKGPVPLSLKAGLLDLNGWTSTAIGAKSIWWRKAGKTMDWQRICDARELHESQGAWATSDGRCCSVRDGKCSFVEPPSDVMLSIPDGGLLTLNGWRAVFIRQKSISWRKGSKSVEWTRKE